MDNNKLYALNREGTSQLERFPEALSGDYVKIDERSIADLVRQSAEYANYVRYYNNSNKEEGRWRAFFEEIYDYKEKRARFSSLEELERKASTSPHLALFLAFLRLFGIAQDHLNTLTEAHLDFYYKEILQLKPRPEIPDSVPLFFQLNKAAQQAMVPANTLFPAGSDKNGKPLFYASKNDLIVNKAKVGVVKGIYKANSQIYLINDMLSKADNRDSGLTDTFLGAICNETARYGFAIASPLLHLKDGIRDITITEFADMSSYFDVEYSSESGWEEAVFDKNMIRIVEQQPPVVAYNESIHQAGFDTDYPVIRLIYKNGKANFDLKIPKIKVSVKGTKDFLLRNDYGVVNQEQVFFPFGVRPVKDSTLRIYNKNIFNSYLKEETVKINIKWKGKPFNFPAHYAGYTEKPKDEFDDSEYLLSTSTRVNAWTADLELGYAERKLQNDLGYSVYQNLYADVAIAKATKTDSTATFPNQPYTPEISAISLDYTVEANIDTLFRIHPLGHVKGNVEDTLFENIENEGELLIGLDNMDAPVILTLYIRLRDYGNNPDKIIDSYPDWYYLANNEWRIFEKSKIISDSTNRFTGSGIVSLSIPPEAFTPHTILPEDKVWLKVAFNENSDAFPSIENITTQVVDAAFINQDNDLAHLEKGLSPNTISKPLTTIQGVKSVSQPYPSYGGRAIEEKRTFYTRVSERLRHKDRAWNIWDYERLILENFPSIFKVKCIPNINPNAIYSPGDILIVLLPDCRIIQQKDIYKPKVTLQLLYDIKEFIESRCSQSATIFVQNAEYEEIKVDCKVTFTKECSDTSYYQNLLHEELKTFLSPWTKEDTNTINFFKTLSKSQIIYFIEKRPYVDFVDDLKVSMGSKNIDDDDTIISSKQNAILTTSKNHLIKGK